MFNIALAWAFLLATLVKPGGILATAIFGDGLRQIPAYQQVLVGIFANYWLPAIVIYLALRIVRAPRFLRPDVTTHVVLGVANVLLALLVVLRVFTSMIEGGGATFVLMSAGQYVMAPCRWALIAGTAWLVLQSIRRHRAGESAPAAEPLLQSASVTFSLAMLLVPVGFFAWLYASNFEKISAARIARETLDSRFEQVCKTVRIDVRKTVDDARSVFLARPSGYEHGLLNQLDFVEVRRNANDLAITRYTKKDNQPALVNGKMQEVNKEVVPEATAQYEISFKPQASPEDQKLGIRVEETTVSDRANGDVLAVFTAVTRVRGVHQTGQCPREFGVNYKHDVIWFVLGLLDQAKAREVADKIASVVREPQ